MPHKDLAAKRACDLRRIEVPRPAESRASQPCKPGSMHGRSGPRTPELGWPAVRRRRYSHHHNSGPGRTRSLVTVTNTDPDVLEPFFRMWPGKRPDYTPAGSANARPATSWTAQGESSGLPGRRTTFPPDDRVRAEFDLLLEVQALRQKGSRAPGYADLMLSYREQMRILNQRGIHWSVAPGSKAGMSPLPDTSASRAPPTDPLCCHRAGLHG